MYVPLWVVIFLIVVGVAAAVTLIAALVWNYRERQSNRVRQQSYQDFPHISEQEMNSPYKAVNHVPSSSFDGPQGIGGWLIWFQIRIYVGIAQALVDFSAEYLFSLIPLIICLFLFYQRNIRFRIPYIIAAFISLLYLILTYAIDSYVFLGTAVGFFLIEGGIIYALFHSRRVANTFH